MKRGIIFLLVLVLFIYGCEQVVCNSPYIQVGAECCLDTDDNKICDKDEVFDEASKIVITETEQKIVEKEVKKFVCSDGSIVTDASNCPIEESQPIVEDEEIVIPNLVETNEEGTVIETFIAEPACPSGLNGGMIYFDVGSIAANISFQVKEGGGEYSDVFTLDRGLYERYTYFAICDKCRGTQLDFKLKPDKVYIMRVKFDQTPLYDRIEYTNEYLIDAREDSEYMLKLCSK